MKLLIMILFGLMVSVNSLAYGDYDGYMVKTEGGVELINNINEVHYLNWNSAEPNYIVQIDPLDPEEPQSLEQWPLNMINAPDAWKKSEGEDIVIAVIDTGVDYTHPDLKDNMWINKGEIPGNEIDDDENGYVDDVYGYDFANDDGDPMDDHNHGTHCSGIIGAIKNDEGITGVAPKVKIMALKFLTASGRGSYFGALKAIKYAKDMGASVISASWGGYQSSPLLKETIMLTNLVFVAAAGNESNDNDGEEKLYPASYDLDNIISVASIDSERSMSYFSNWGMDSVDIAAPGSSIVSTIAGGGYKKYSGTSMATPHVAGVAGLVYSWDKDLSVKKVKEMILDNAIPEESLADKVLSGGILNANVW